jgi:hypothetical protein
LDPICINISEIVQADAAVMVTAGAVMVTLGAPQCMSRAKPKRAQLRHSDTRACAIMIFWNRVLDPAFHFEPSRTASAFCRRRAFMTGPEPALTLISPVPCAGGRRMVCRVGDGRTPAD